MGRNQRKKLGEQTTTQIKDDLNDQKFAHMERIRLEDERIKRENVAVEEWWEDIDEKRKVRKIRKKSGSVYAVEVARK
jgi:glutamate mutase epsilon subunit